MEHVVEKALPCSFTVLVFRIWLQKIEKNENG